MNSQQIQSKAPAQASSRAEVEKQKTTNKGDGTMEKIMTWVDELPGAASTDFPAKRDEIAKMMDEAAELTRKADELRGRAYFAACSLEGEARGVFTFEQVEQAKQRAG